MLNRPALEAALKRIGKGAVFVGDPFTANGLAPLGATEGEIVPTFAEEFNDLTFPEYTGPIVHERQVMGEGVSLAIPVIMGDPALYAKLSPTGLTGGGSSSHTDVVTTSLVVISYDDIGAGISYAPVGTGPAAWSPAAPEHAIWVWRGHFTRGGPTYKQGDGGKTIQTVNFQGMYDAARPEGHKVYTIGDPAAQGVVGLAI